MKMKKKTKKRIVNAFIYVIMTLVSLTMLFPFIWMISTSLKEKTAALEIPIRLIPDPIVWEEYTRLWEVIPLLTGVKNTLIIAVPLIVCGQLMSALSAFAFAKMEIPAKKALFMGLLSTMMIPGIITMIPQYVVWGDLGLTDSFVPLIAPGLLGSIGSMFFYRQYLNGVPRELIEVSRIDGASWMKVFTTIFLPLMRPAIATQVIFGFMGVWNDFMGPLIYLDSESKYTVQLMLRLLNSMGEATSEYPLIMAGAVVSCIPLLTLYICFQRYFVDTMVITGIKG